MRIEIVVLIAVIALIVGFVIGCLLSKKKPIGVLQVDRSQPNEPPYLFLELYNQVDFYKYKTVTLTVLNENLASRKY